MDWVNRVTIKLDNHNERRSGPVVLLIENLNVYICKFKKDFILRGGGAEK